MYLGLEMVTPCITTPNPAYTSGDRQATREILKFCISMKTIETVLETLNLLSAAFVWWYNPQAVLAGGLLGALVRRFVRDNEYSFENSESKRKSNRIAQMNFTLMAAAYSAFTHNQAIRATDAGQPFTAPFILGFVAVANGIYPIARKLVVR